MKLIRNTFLFVSLTLFIFFSHTVQATCIVENDANSGEDSLRYFANILQNNSNNTCRETDGYYRVWFVLDPDQDGVNDWQTVRLESGISITNTSRMMTIGDKTTSIGIDATGLGKTCLFSIQDDVILTLRSLTFYVDAGVTLDDVICGTWYDGGNIQIDDGVADDTTDNEDNNEVRTPLALESLKYSGAFLDTLVQIDNDKDGFSKAEGDCDPQDGKIYPGAPEVCDDIDNNCDEVVDEGVTTTYYADLDGDGYGTTATTKGSSVDACEAPSGYVADNTDCDDTNNTVSPIAEEVCDNGVDDDCDDLADEDCVAEVVVVETITDDDGDGYEASTDCDDESFSINPGAVEVLANSLDDDCDGDIDEDDAAGAVAVETKTADLDSDADGLIDDYENKIGTDPQNPDTDGDGITDLHDLDPLNALVVPDSDDFLEEQGNSKGGGCTLVMASLPFDSFWLSGILGFIPMFLLLAMRARVKARYHF